MKATKGIVGAFPMFISEEKGGRHVAFDGNVVVVAPWLVQPGAAVTRLQGRDSSPFYKGGKAVSAPGCDARNRVLGFFSR